MTAPSRPRAGRLSLVFLAVIAVGLLIRGFTTEPEAEGPMVGVTAPEIQLRTFDDETWTLSEHLETSDGITVVNLWASWCLPCREEIPELSRFAVANPEVTVVGVAVRDEFEAARELAAELEPTYLVGIDDTGRLRDQYPGFGLPATFVIDRQGIVRHQLERPLTAADLEEVVGRAGIVG